MALKIIILAAGAGTRMRSNTPKVLHTVAGTTMLQHVLNASKTLNPEHVFVVCGHEAGKIKASIQDEDIFWVEQNQQLGTGHAVMQCLPHLNADDIVLILYGDVPLISTDTLKKLVASASLSQPTVLSVNLSNPSGYGRLVFSGGVLADIVEEKDASNEQRLITQVNTGIFCASGASLQSWVGQLTPDNAQREYYLTDIVKLAYIDRTPFINIDTEDETEVLGANNKRQLAQLERYYQYRLALTYMNQGLHLIDPNRLDVRGMLSFGTDVSIDANVTIEGDVVLGNHVQVGANSIIRNSTLGDGVIIEPMSIVDGSVIGSESIIGPFARIRPGTVLEGHNKIGNFVEVKSSIVGAYSKSSHLTYLGNATIGQRVNIGAGTITCNYDGTHKYETQIDSDAFIGSGTQLVAPVIIGEGATVGAGSVITKDVTPNVLAVSRVEQKEIPGWLPSKKSINKKNSEN
jgi:bifunctional UDP-N-acetylglucosamine pyrophosphorylase/glucosamine-1-phosphate N-acetyltransferase